MRFKGKPVDKNFADENGEVIGHGCYVIDDDQNPRQYVIIEHEGQTKKGRRFILVKDLELC